MRHLILPGVLLILGALWGGCYVVGALPDYHWAKPAVGITAYLVALAGFALTIIGICEPPRKP